MGQVAARVGDSTAHGTPLLGVGSTNVLIGGMPAWRANVDFHTCPLVTGTVPHAGGIISKPPGTVLINGFPPAVVGDQIIEAGAPNSIISGEYTVLIG